MKKAAKRFPSGWNPRKDWTMTPAGTTNASKRFEYLVDEVDKIIRGSGHSLITGNSNTVARLIVAQLAHVHKLRPGR